ncbi:MAG: M20/M25/M40 family metallo-hydrolase [Anaerolinea sp.]|nr:M20/M25/M40 family metallo-hydrolase [Anaerolinea sp.]MCC6972436.1 M20/M25/M40 family metallo-hydrolase [Anaerolineae bacterium]CAG0979657.1 succinyl-diaminopimelate desuccinylase [Anaerolineae bacterium]
MNYTKIDQYISDHLSDSLAELARLCAQPSISAQGVGIAECAQLVGAMLAARGFKVEIVPTNGHPIVYAEAEGASDKTLLFYNHYDVQPPEPLELWTTPAFEPTIREGKMYARGVSDDKGHFQSRLAALDAFKAVTGSYPCRIKFVVEGEEETSSASLPGFVYQNAEKLRADACVWEFGSVDHENRPVQYLGLRGICYVELTVETADYDAHSGLAGSIFPNAGWRLVWALNTLKDSGERILIPGFYEDVKPPSARDLELLAALPDDAPDLLTRYGLKRGFLKGMMGGPEFQREAVFVPTCTICGLTSGYQEKGAKTVLPAKASAKVDFRLVPDQDPEDIARKLRKHLDAQGFEDVRIDVLGTEHASRTDPDDPFVQMAIRTARDVYQKEVIVAPMVGGSGPTYPFAKALHVPIVTVGCGYPGARVHAPDENIVISLFELGIKHTAHLLGEFAQG